MEQIQTIISILAWNSPHYLENILENLLVQYRVSADKKKYSIAILDQGSNQATKDVLKKYSDKIECITLEENIGFSKGHNYLYKTFRKKYAFDYFCPLNSDVLVEEDFWLDKLIQCLESDEKNAIAGPAGVEIIRKGPGKGDGRVCAPAKMMKGEFDFISGSFFLVKSSVIERYGLFDEQFSPAYFEDADLNFRYKEQGCHLKYCPVAHSHKYMKHLNASGKNITNEMLLEKYGDFYRKNKARFLERWESEKVFRKPPRILLKKGLSKIKKRVSESSARSKFTEIYRKNLFKGKESVSGPGSDLQQTKLIREAIPPLLKKYAVKKMIDAPCGDYFWMQKVDRPNTEYIGIDIVNDLIDRNSQEFHNERTRFECIDIIKGDLPQADLILCRDCLVHLTYDQVFQALENFKRSGAKYLLTTTFPEQLRNKDLRNTIWRPLNLQKAPFGFPEPLELINEGCTEDNGQYADKSLALWSIKDLPLGS